MIEYFILSHSYRISDKIDHFDLLDLQISISKDSDKILEQIETLFNEYQIDIKQMKKFAEDENESGPAKLKIIAQYNKESINKNHVIRKLSLIENISEVIQE